MYSFENISDTVFLLMDSDIVEEDTSQALHTYFDNIVAKTSLVSSSRSIGPFPKEEDVKTYFKTLNMVDTNDVPMTWDQLNNDEKTIFLERWKETLIADYMARSNEEPDTLNSIKAFNTANRETAIESRSSGNSLALEEIFSQKYSSILKASTKVNLKNEDEEGTRASWEIPQYRITQIKNNAMSRLKSSYRTGRVIVIPDNKVHLYIADEAGQKKHTLGWGQASIFANYSYSWNSAWEVDPEAKITASCWVVTPYGVGGNAPKSAVAWDPIKMWTMPWPYNNLAVQIDQYKIYRVQDMVWVWDWFKSGWKAKEASSSKYKAAARNARSFIGVKHVGDFWKTILEGEYTVEIGFNSNDELPEINGKLDGDRLLEGLGGALTTASSKWWQDVFTEGTYVWRSWYNVSSDYDISNWGVTWVVPHDIKNTENTKEINSVDLRP